MAMFTSGTDVQVKVIDVTYSTDLESAYQTWLQSTPKKIILDVQISSKGNQSGLTLVITYKE